MTAADEVLAAAASLVAAFARHDTEAYFDAFAPDATFVFYTTAQRLDSRAAYRQLWADWEADGFGVLSCSSADQLVQLLGDGGAGDAAVFSHTVTTRVRFGAEEQTLRERETIVFRRVAGGRWLAMHEHLSPQPQEAGS